MANNILQSFMILFETDADVARRKIEGAGDAAEGSAKALDAALQDANNAAARLAKAMETAGGVDGLDTATIAANDLEDALRRMGDADPATLEATVSAIENELNRADDAARKLDGQLGSAGAEARDLDRAADGAAGKIVDAARAATHLSQQMNEATRNAVEVGKSFVDNLKGVMGLVGGLFLVQQAGQSIAAQFRNIVDLTDKASRYNFNIEGLQAYGQVLEDAGGNAQDAERYIRRFSDAIATAFGDKASAPGKALAALGLSAATAQGDLKDTEEVLLDLAGALEGVNRRVAIDRLKDLGIIDPAMVKTVLAGREALQKLMDTERAKGVVTAEGAAKARELKMAIDDVKDVAGALFNTLVARLGPGLSDMANRLVLFSTWLRENATLVKGFGIGAAAALGIVAAVLWGSYIPAWTAAAIATLAATWPLVAITAAVLAAAAAFALLWEDVQFFLKGQPSLLGDLIQKYDWVRKGVDAIVAAWRFLAAVVPEIVKTVGQIIGAVFRGIWGVIGPVLDLIVEGFRLVGAVQRSIMSAIWETVQSTFSKWWPFIQPVFDLIIAGIKGVAGVFSSIAKLIWGEWAAMFDRFLDRVRLVVAGVRVLTGLAKGAREGLERAASGGRAQPALPALAAGQSQLAAAAASPLNAKSSPVLAAGRPSVSRTNSTRIDKVVVNTQATDADGVAKALGGALSSELSRAHAEANDGVER